MLDSAREYLIEQCGRGDRLLLAVSGGADSLAMLLLLAEDREFRGRIVCATVDHRLRESSADDVEYLRSTCAERGIEFDSLTVDTYREMQARRLSLEAAARRVRYCALEEMRTRSSCQWILTAHTLDDDAETVLMKLKAESSWYECTGIPRRRGVILRPFLTTRRGELRAYLRGRDFSAREDEHNENLRFARVKIRHWLSSLPEEDAYRIVLEAVAHGRNLRGFLARACEVLSADLQAKQKQYFANSFEIDIDEDIRYLNSLVFLSVEAAVRLQREEADFRLSAASRRRTTEFATGTGDRGLLRLPEGVELRREGRRLRVTLTWDSEASRGSPLTEGALEVSKARVRGAIRFRAWSYGETFKPAKRRTRKISDWLRDCGVPSEERSRVKVLCDESGIIGIPGLGVAERVLPQLGEETLRVNCVD